MYLLVNPFITNRISVHWYQRSERIILYELWNSALKNHWKCYVYKLIFNLILLLPCVLVNLLCVVRLYLWYPNRYLWLLCFVVISIIFNRYITILFPSFQFISFIWSWFLFLSDHSFTFRYALNFSTLTSTVLLLIFLCMAVFLFHLFMFFTFCFIFVYFHFLRFHSLSFVSYLPVFLVCSISFL